jgi:hypothetical protein
VEGSGGSGRAERRASEKGGGSGRYFRGEGEGVAVRGGGRGSGGNVPEHDVQVFADTLGMQGGGVAVSVGEVLRNTFPPPRSPLAPLVPGTKKTFSKVKAP